MISKEQVENINLIDRSVIQHPQIKKAIDTIEENILLSSCSVEPFNTFVAGKGGVGKTTASHIIINRRKKEVRKGIDRISTIIPAFYTSIPDPATPKSLAIQMLLSLHEKNSIKGTATHLTARLRTLLIECGTEVIILDELQHLLKKDSERTQEIKNWIKTIVNDTKISMVLIGTPECEIIIDDESDKQQLSRRFTSRVHLSNLSHQHSNTKSDYYKFIVKLVLNFKDITDTVIHLHDEHNIDMLYLATGGNPANTTQLFKKACFKSLSKSSSSVTIDHFRSAYDSLTLPCRLILNENPFSMDSMQTNNIMSSQSWVKNG